MQRAGPLSPESLSRKPQRTFSLGRVLASRYQAREIIEFPATTNARVKVIALVRRLIKSFSRVCGELVSSPAIEVKFADSESFHVDCSTKTCCGRQVSSALPRPTPSQCLPISKLFQEGSLTRKFYFYRQIFFAPLSQFDLHRARALCSDNLAFLCSFGFSRSWKLFLEEVYRSVWFFAEIPREASSKALSLAWNFESKSGSGEKERKAHECREEMSFVDDQGDSQGEEASV